MHVVERGPGDTAADHVSSSEGVVSAVAAELRERLGEERFAIVGNSFGGMIARKVAHDCRGQGVTHPMTAGRGAVRRKN